jgi:glycosyltransferase involved in cell wall biosynthesis
VFNGQPHLRHTVETILSQEGDFFLDYRIQDGCSSDDGLAMLLDVEERIRSGELPLRCRGVRVLIESRPDRGLYDAVAAGFSHGGPLSDQAGDVFTYLNADDEMLPGSFQTAVNVMQAVGAEWVCGQIRIIDTAGNLLRTPRFPLAYSRQDILEGKHLGYLYFLQQEGTFWTRSLYEKAGGIRPALRLAGDYDLWRRFAGHSELLAVDRPLASFRSRPGQLSEDLESYYEEIRSRGLLPRRHWQFLSRPHKGLEPPAERERMAALEQQAAGSFFARVPWELRSRSFAGAGDQREGPLCFLNERGEVREVVYLRRTWFGQETV